MGEPGRRQKARREFGRIPFLGNKVTLKVYADFETNVDTAEFYYLDKGQWNRLGIKHQLYFRLDHFTGCGLDYSCTPPRKPAVWPIIIISYMVV